LTQCVTDPEGQSAEVVDPETFGVRLQAAREAAGLTQRSLAARAALDGSYVSLLESGARRATVRAATALATALAIDADDLLGRPVLAVQKALVLAGMELENGQPAAAAARLEPLIARLSDDALLADRGMVDALSMLATALERSARLAEAVALWERLRALAERSPERVAYLPAVQALLRCYRDLGDKARAIELGEVALQRSRALGLPLSDVEMAKMVSTLAGVYMERGDAARAKGLLDELALESEKAGSRESQGYALWNAAINAVESGHAAEGRRLAERASGLLAESADDRSRARVRVTQAWVLLGQDPPQPSDARRILRQALPELRKHAGAGSVASAEVELARCELLLGRPDVAARHAKSALRRLGTPGETGPLMGRARACAALGAAMFAGGESAAGLLELERAADELRALDASPAAAALWRELSQVYASAGQTGLAWDAAMRALDVAGVAGQAAVVPATGVGRADGPRKSAAPKQSGLSA
jgi:transcriptional regulator with XRE-family HTH domain